MRWRCSSPDIAIFDTKKLFWIYDFGLREHPVGVFAADALGFAFGFYLSVSRLRLVSARSAATSLKIGRKSTRQAVSLGSN